jgi:hypothetical protein
MKSEVAQSQLQTFGHPEQPADKSFGSLYFVLERSQKSAEVKNAKY